MPVCRGLSFAAPPRRTTRGFDLGFWSTAQVVVRRDPLENDLAMSAASSRNTSGSAAHVEWLVGTLGLAAVELTRPADLLVRILDHLVPLRDPADGTRDGEQHG